MTELSDEALIISSRGGDRGAVDLLYRRHHDAAFRFARRLMGNGADADDVAHEAFTKVIAAIGRGNGPEAVFRPYLFRAVRTVAADHWDQQSKEVPSEQTPDTGLEDLGLEAVLSQDSITPVYRAFESLPARWRTVLWHAEVENEPPRRIAPLLGMEPNAVSALLMRARRGLREAYLHEYAAGELPQAGCQPTLPYLAGTVLGTASARDRGAAKEHARGCEDCRKVIAELTDIRKTMRVLVAPVLLLSPSLAASTLPVPRWNPRPWLSTGFLAGSAIAGIAAAVGLVLLVQGTGTPTQHTIAVQESTSPSPHAPATASGSGPGTPSGRPGPPTIDSSTAAGPAAVTEPGGNESPAVPFLPLRPANPPRNPSPGPHRNPPPTSAAHPAPPKPSPGSTTVPAPTPSPSRPAPSPTPSPTTATPMPTPTPSPTTATPMPTPTSSPTTTMPSAGTFSSPTATPTTPASPPPACVPFLIWCLPG
ncbi:sigma-70 family RNA polymerase sigma factor [Arthrobacter sp. 2RAF22]|uniref:sigma-70 family RNA polymerase sigma factor n=1 Tax=Arthrobacter sp. 2RAF22 TaxID=3232996 RepID=UPI003F8F1FCA